MKKVDEDFLYVCGLLNEHGAEYIAGGAVAMGLHGHVRATRDIDVMIPSDLENTRRVLAALEKLPMRAAREMSPETVNEKAITIIGDDPKVDLMKAMGPLSYREAAETAETRTIRGITVRYLSLDALKKAKETGRDQDRVDLEELKRIEMHRRDGTSSNAAGSFTAGGQRPGAARTTSSAMPSGQSADSARRASTTTSSPAASPRRSPVST